MVGYLRRLCPVSTPVPADRAPDGLRPGADVAPALGATDPSAMVPRAAPFPRAGLLLSLLAGGCSPGDPMARYGGDLPHVLVVTIDTLRADHLGCYGYYRDTSPHLDALAEESVLFERCLTPVSQTLPTHASLFTGLYPYEHGVLANVFRNSVYELSPSIQTFAQAMAEAGYGTSAFIASEPLKRVAGLRVGFQDWWEPEEWEVPASRIVDEALAWLHDSLEAPGDRPLMMWVHVFDTHAPYKPPEPYDELFASDEDVQDEWFEEHGISMFVKAKLRAFQGDARTDHNRYDGELRFVDDELGRFFDELRSEGLWEDLVVVLTSDHGESLKQHATNGHGDIWVEQIRVPFLIKAPGLAAGRVEARVSTVDILPTALGCVPRLGEALSGWREQATGRDALAPDFGARPIFGQLPSNRGPGVHSVVHDGWRLTLRPEAPHLYHLDEDPHELRNLADERADLVEELSALIEATEREHRARGEELQTGGMREASPERLRNLEALGYGGGGEEEEDE